jgi:hypothetical protein
VEERDVADEGHGPVGHNRGPRAVETTPSIPLAPRWAHRDRAVC